MPSFGDTVAKLCTDKYNSLKKTGKPGESEWTVLAGIIVKHNDSLSLVSLATGTKCLSGAELINTKLYEIGDRLSDSHAEILARRGFLLYLYDQIDLLLTLGESEILIMAEDGIKVKNEVSIHFYCSQSPCGDCSIIPMETDEMEDNLIPVKKRKSMNENDFGKKLIKDIHRTGAKCLSTESKQDFHLPGVDYHVTGPLRTKPGRGDPTLSLSCSDKIAKWNVIGIQGSLLSLFIAPLRLETIVIGNDTPFSHEAMERGIYKRFGDHLTGPEVVQATVVFSHKKSAARCRPCPSSIVWCSIRNRNTEVTVDGRKQGATKNKKGNSLLVSRRTFLKKFLNVVEKSSLMKNVPLHPKKIYYHHCKQWCTSYQRKWKNLKDTIFSTWPEKPAILQNFAL